QNKYDEAIDNLKKSLDYKAKLNNLYIILGNSCLLCNYYFDATRNYNIALKNDPNNYLCLKNCAYSYEKQGDYLNALKILGKLLSINNEDSLVLCYYGEILCNMTQRSKVGYIIFYKANIMDPENIHNLNKRAIAYYILQEYDKVLSDLDKIIQLDPLNSSAFYLKSLTYYTKNDINNSTILFKKYAALLNSDNSLAIIQLFHLEYLLTNNSFKILNNILTKINQIPESDLLRFIRCNIYIKLKEYYKAKVELDSMLLSYKFGLIGYFIQYSDFWSYLHKVCKIDKFDKIDFTKFGIVNGFSKYMYKEKRVYFILNLTNLNSELCQFQESDINSLLGQVHQNDHTLKHEDVSKLEGLGWIEYKLPIFVSHNFQLTIEIDSIEMQIDYVRFEDHSTIITHIPNMSLMGYLLPDYYRFLPNVPETFKDNNL
ncbi:TPR-like protein, partial [Rhizophagus irregularis]